jgi:hypothetical protein
MRRYFIFYTPVFVVALQESVGRVEINELFVGVGAVASAHCAKIKGFKEIGLSLPVGAVEYIKPVAKFNRSVG